MSTDLMARIQELEENFIKTNLMQAEIETPSANGSSATDGVIAELKNSFQQMKVKLEKQSAASSRLVLMSNEEI